MKTPIIKILIVENETIVALDIKNSIIKMGFEVTNTVTNHTDALHSVKTDRPDFIIMDIRLEHGKDGIDIAHDVQKIAHIPIIYLTGFTDDKTVSRAVETNPLAYLCKPFKREELKTTILLGIYKLDNQNKDYVENNCFKLGFHYYYDLENEQLFYKHMTVKLSRHENKLLRLLIDAKGNIVPFTTLEYEIWEEIPCDSGLRTLIYRLRAKLEYKLIETIPSFGCRLTNNF